MKHMYQNLAGAVLSVAVLMGGLSPAMADDQNRIVTIVNKTGVTMVAFFASHTDMENWGEDHLGEYVLPSRFSVEIDFSNDGSGYCKYDFRAEFEDEDVLEEWDVDVCEIGTYTYR